jgi:hypothetical protein
VELHPNPGEFHDLCAAVLDDGSLAVFNFMGNHFLNRIVDEYGGITTGKL